MKQSEESKEVTILFYSIPLHVELDKMELVLSPDKVLNEAVIEYSKQLAAQDIETFKTDRNMIITEGGYKIAVYGKEESILGK